ncbi:uncharacterized protein LOC129272308 [Lytechinus pictus]|uniref:uncharacterized protein LOC129272308 n=1 Tax=Lytechinus pictus TaxID=7653 RepID=UPI0030B9F819
MTTMIRITQIAVSLVIGFAVIQYTIAKKPEPDRSIAAVVMSLCTPYQEAKKEYDMKCNRTLTDGLKGHSDKAKIFIEAADSKTYCTGNENEGSLLRFDTACHVIAHLCDYMQLGELMKCPHAQPLTKRKSHVKSSSKKSVRRKE